MADPNANWFYLENGEQKGPITEAQLLNMVLNKTLPPTARVWNPNKLSGWQPVNEVPLFAKQLKLSSIMNPNQSTSPKMKTRIPLTEHNAAQDKLGVWGDKSQSSKIEAPTKPVNIFNLLVPVLLIGLAFLGFTNREIIESRFAPYFTGLYASSGSTRLAAGDLKGAQEDYSHALRLKPDQAEPHYGLGMIAYKSKDQNTAITEFQQALKYDPKLGKAHYGIGMIKLELGDVDAAVNEFSQGLAVDSKCADCYVGRAKIREQANNLDGAVMDYQAASKLFSTQGKMLESQNTRDLADHIIAVRDAYKH